MIYQIFAAPYGENVYNSGVYESAVESATTSGSLADTGLYAGMFIIVGLVIITLALVSQKRRKQNSYVA